jgi:hypothetical protein
MKEEGRSGTFNEFAERVRKDVHYILSEAF